MWKNVKWTYHESSGEHSGQGTIFGVCPYGFGLRWDISGHWYRGFAQNFDTFHMGRVVLPAEPFLKKCPNIRKRPLFSKYACPFFQEQVPKMSFSPMSHRQPLAMGSSRGGAPRKCRGGLGGGAAPPGWYNYIVLPDTGVISEWLVLQYFQKSRLYQNEWSFSISRKGGYTMVGPSVFPEKQVISKWLVLQYFQKSGLYQNGGSFSISRKGGYFQVRNDF